MVGKRLVRKLSGLNGASLHGPNTLPPPLSPRGGLAGASVGGMLATGGGSLFSNTSTEPALATSPRAAIAKSASQPVQDKALVTKLLAQFKQTSEVRQYLKLFGSVDSTRFAIVKISGDVLTNPEETAKVAASLAFLHKMGLVPIVVHGAGLFSGRQAAEVRAVGAGSGTQLLAAAQEAMSRSNAALVAALQAEGVGATPLMGGVFDTARDPAHFGNLGAAAGVITGVRAEAISAAVAAGSIPVVAALGGAAEAAMSFSTNEATLALAKLVQPLKVICLRSEGGLRRRDGAAVQSVDLARDAPELLSLVEASAAASAKAVSPAASVWAPHYSDAGLLLSVAHGPLGLAPSDAHCLVEMASLYSVMHEPGCSVAATTPDCLAEELLSRKGSGTLVSKGARVVVHEDLGAVDVPRLVALVEGAFGAELPPTFFADLVASGRLRRVYLTDDYRAAAIVTTEPGLPGVAYLDKFATAPSAQGDKLGEALWRVMVEREAQLYWRSRTSNRVNPWYFQESDGALKAKTGEWTVFWRGLDDAQVMPAVKAALEIKPTFAPRVYPPHKGTGPAPTQQPVLK